MFVPPEDRHFRPPPDNPPRPRRVLSKREEGVLLWLVGVFLLLTLLAPLGGSSVVIALWYVLHH